MSLTTNNTNLQTILDTVNALPDAGSGMEFVNVHLDSAADVCNVWTNGTPTTPVFYWNLDDALADCQVVANDTLHNSDSPYYPLTSNPTWGNVAPALLLNGANGSTSQKGGMLKRYVNSSSNIVGYNAKLPKGGYIALYVLPKSFEYELYPSSSVELVKTIYKTEYEGDTTKPHIDIYKIIGDLYNISNDV